MEQAARITMDKRVLRMELLLTFLGNMGSRQGVEVAIW
jgi:hypothetical protein